MTLDEQHRLLNSIKSNPQEFGALFDEFYSPIFGYIFKRIGDYDVSRDVAAETFLKAYLNIAKFTWNNISISAWLYKIATNEINLYFRKNKYSPSSLTNLLDTTDFDFANPETYEEEKERLEQELKHHHDFLEVQKHLKTLHTKYQEVIALRYFEDKSIQEVSEILEKKEGTIKSLISRGLEKIRVLMEKP